MAHFSVALVGKPSCVWVRPGIPGTLCHFAPSGLAASCGVEIYRLQRPSIRAGSHARHPILYASFDESGKSFGGYPILTTAYFVGPEFARDASTITQTSWTDSPRLISGFWSGKHPHCLGTRGYVSDDLGQSTRRDTASPKLL